MTTDQELAAASPGKRIEIHRKSHGMTQQQCAALVGVSMSTWRKWEYNDRLPSIYQWGEIARILRVTDLYKLTGVAHAIAADDPVEHRTVRPILNAMLGLPEPALRIEAERYPAAVRDIWRYWQGTGVDRHDNVGVNLPMLILSGEDAVRATTGEEQRDVRAALASTYQLTWSYLRGVGSPELGLIAAEKSRRAAQDTDRPESIAAAMWGQAAILSSARQTEAALALCYQLTAELEPRILTETSRDLLAIYGQAHLLASVQATRLRLNTRAAELLAIADRVADRTGETNSFHTAFGRTNVLMHRATAAVEGLDYRQAIQIGSQVDPRQSPSVERRVAHHVNIAHAYMSTKNPVAALAELEAACGDDAAETRSLVVAHETLRRLRSRPTPSTARRVEALTELLQPAA